MFHRFIILFLPVQFNMSPASEVTRVTSLIMESTYKKVGPVVENTLEIVTPVMDSVKSNVE